MFGYFEILLPKCPLFTILALFIKVIYLAYPMSVQPKRRTSSQKKRRASHFALTKAGFSTCAKCGLAVQPHHLCPHCGEYRKGKPA